MAALPYMQLYVADYLADTNHLKAIQHGAYLLLLMNYWQRGKALIDSNDRLATVARMSKEEWFEHRETLAEFFEIVDGFWVHHRVERDLERVCAITEGASKAGKASANARKQRKANAGSTTVEKSLQRPLNHIYINNINKDKRNGGVSEDEQQRQEQLQIYRELKRSNSPLWQTAVREKLWVVKALEAESVQ